MLVCIFVLLYSPFVVYLYKLNSIYSNPFFRLLEFVVGMLLAAIVHDFKGRVDKYICNWFTIIAANLILIIGVSIGVSLNVELENFMLYSWIYLPCFVVNLIGLSGIQSRVLAKSKLLKVASESTFSFFLAQLYSNQISSMIISKYKITANINKIVLGWSLCIVITIWLRFIELFIKRKLKNCFKHNIS